jgi:Autographiviridae endonuclease VII
MAEIIEFDRARDYRYKRLYGITLQEYERILAEQNGSCAGCGWKPKPGQRRLHVDHNHKTLKVRGIVCWKCNSAIKKLRDSSMIAYNLYVYLKKAGD